MVFDMDTLPPSAAAEAITGIVLTILAYAGIVFGVYKLCTCQRAVPSEMKKKDAAQQEDQHDACIYESTETHSD